MGPHSTTAADTTTATRHPSCTLDAPCGPMPCTSHQSPQGIRRLGRVSDRRLERQSLSRPGCCRNRCIGSLQRRFRATHRRTCLRLRMSHRTSTAACPGIWHLERTSSSWASQGYRSYKGQRSTRIVHTNHFQSPVSDLLCRQNALHRPTFHNVPPSRPGTRPQRRHLARRSSRPLCCQNRCTGMPNLQSEDFRAPPSIVLPSCSDPSAQAILAQHLWRPRAPSETPETAQAAAPQGASLPAGIARKRARASLRGGA
mmetsp:Transcript_80357/g.260440  ORF Transcript_80357/g.260440 Transcript_80357/m.260440 type:complete len:257 (+) Transcript_80357:451-1221(+)